MQNLFFGRKISQFSLPLLLATALAILTGCGSGGAATGAVAGTTVTAASVQLLVDKTEIPSSGATPINLTAVVLDGSGQTLAGRTVAFSKGGDATAYISNTSGTSDANGTATAKLNLGTNKSNRTITVSATVDGVAASTTIYVTGTTVSISGNTSLSFGATSTLAVSVKDSAGNAIANMPVTVTSQNGNTISLSSLPAVTGAGGTIGANVTATKTGNDVITATAGGASTTAALTISSSSFTFTAPTAVAPATTPEIPLNTPTPVSIYWTNAGVPVSTTAVNFSTSRGSISGNPTTTQSGLASVTISSNSAGPAIISAAGPGGTPAATLNVDFVATTAQSVTAQANPSTIQVTTGGTNQTSNTSQISVIVRDASNNLVKNAKVDFAITADPSGGSLSASTATTDANGTASVSYTAGTTSSPQNGVSISATVVEVRGITINPQPSYTANLTVSGQSLFVRLGTDQNIGTIGTAPVSNTKSYTAIVTDSAGNPVPNTTVRFILRPGRYRKGYYSPGSPWVQTVTVTCPNEDLNFNGILDSGEDNNHNGQLDPGGIASVNTTAATDANGFATAVITYPKDHGTWVEVTLEARTGVVGNDPPATVTLELPGVAADYGDPKVAPPGVVSPYGQGTSCSDTQ